MSGEGSRQRNTCGANLLCLPVEPPPYITRRVMSSACGQPAELGRHQSREAFFRWMIGSQHPHLAIITRNGCHVFRSKLWENLPTSTLLGHSFQGGFQFTGLSSGSAKHSQLSSPSMFFGPIPRIERSSRELQHALRRGKWLASRIDDLGPLAGQHPA